jgi:putative transposase
LKEYEGRKKAEVICRRLGITKTTFYTRKKRYSGMDGEQLRRLKELDEENRKLKNMYADLAPDKKCSRMFFRKVVRPGERKNMAVYLKKILHGKHHQSL